MGSSYRSARLIDTALEPLPHPQTVSAFGTLLSQPERDSDLPASADIR